ncbi:MAG: argininosuccinate synthase [Proteobacteria bacterium]|nr:argininosuccinate synthase [Pseudomonadota bacterium]MDA0951983.1 argininosuccinate synthase [Pseudomonadota bacterium]
MSKIKKVVLAYSGGLDTSVILRWLQDTYDCEVVTFTADLGQGEELEPARRKAEMMGVKEIFVEDLREEFVRDFVFPMFRANAAYEGVYLLGTSIARPLIAKRQIEIAAATGADAVAHGATGKGNDQVRFELGYYGLNPDIRVIAPWREWDLTSRTRLIEYAEKHQIPIPRDKRGEAPFSTDANLLHISAEGKVLEDPWDEAPDYVYSRTVDPVDAPDTPTEVTIDFEKGDPVAVDGFALSPAALLTRLNELGGANGVGRLDLVENRFVGMKSRGIYETPGGTVLHHAHRAMESITLDRGAAHLKDEMMPRYAELIYNGFWFSPERKMLQAAIDSSQEFVSGTVRLKLYKGSVFVTGRKSDKSLYSLAHVTFEEDAVYDQRDAEGFIRLNALRLRLGGRRDRG